MSIPEYIAAVRDGDYEKGIELLYETNPFSQVCGRICTHRCESTCAARYEGDAVAIRWLKRHIIDQVPTEKIPGIIGLPDSKTDKKIAIIGAGPAGLTTAYDLARKGHSVTVYEANEAAGGMTRYGILSTAYPTKHWIRMWKLSQPWVWILSTTLVWVLILKWQNFKVIMMPFY